MDGSVVKRCEGDACQRLATDKHEMHWLIVGVGRTYFLKSQPQCELSPLQKFLPPAK